MIQLWRILQPSDQFQSSEILVTQDFSVQLSCLVHPQDVPHHSQHIGPQVPRAVDRLPAQVGGAGPQVGDQLGGEAVLRLVD